MTTPTPEGFRHTMTQEERDGILFNITRASADMTIVVDSVLTASKQHKELIERNVEWITALGMSLFHLRRRVNRMQLTVGVLSLVTALNGVALILLAR